MDTQIFEILSPFSKIPFFVALADILNRLGKGDALAFVGIVMSIYGFFRGNSKFLRAGGAGILTVIFSGVLVQSLKHLIGRARPGENLGDFHFIGPNLQANGFDSFPSGHAMSSFALAAFLSHYFPKFKWLFYSVAAAICVLGRVTFHHHFLTDVVAGGALGILLGHWCAKKFGPWIEKT